MAIAAAQTAISAAAAAVLVSAGGNSMDDVRDIVVKNIGATNNCHIGGGTTVNASTGFPLGPGEAVGFTLRPSDALYCFSTSGTSIAVIRGRV